MTATRSLLDIPAERFQGEDATFRDCMVNRFSGEAGPRLDLDIHDTWVASLANLYVTYWQHALIHPNESAVAENELSVGVGRFVNRSLHVGSDLDSAEDEIQAEVRKRGFYLLLGRTTPLREFMLWKKQTRKSAVHPAIIIICENQAKDKASAHAYANSKIVSELDSRLHINICNESGGHEQVIRDSAAGMLLDDSKSRHGQTKSSPVLSPADD